MQKTLIEKRNRRVNKVKQLPELDRLLIAGLKHGSAEKRKAINKILQLVPQWTRGDCWQRIRYLRNMPDFAEVTKEHVRTNVDPPEHDARATSAGPWTTADDDKLLNLAGYEPVKKIAQRLGRSQRAVRFRLGALGMSAKVIDGWSQRALRKMLRVSRTRLLYLIGSGMLRVRDPRISAVSLAVFCRKMNSAISSSSAEAVADALANDTNGFAWERVADLLGVSRAQVQAWISAGHLKVADPFVPDRAFKDFCQRHGQELGDYLIDPPIAKWLMKEYGVTALAGKNRVVTRAQKHALTVRTCRCGREIAGNAYFRHVRACQKRSQAMPHDSPTVKAHLTRGSRALC
jgi:hypothetical protein